MRSQVYSWRLSPEVKSELERAARFRKTTVSSILEAAVQEWLHKDETNLAGEEEQVRLHSEAALCLGALAGGDPHRAETARAQVKARLGRRRAR